MQIKTQKYQLDKNTYIITGLNNLVREQWWVALLAIALLIGVFFTKKIWLVIVVVLSIVGYILFWVLQFYAMTQLEQGKLLFEKLSYVFSDQNIIMQITTKQGAPFNWDQVQKAYVTSKAIVIIFSRAHFIYLPQRVFSNLGQFKLLAALLKRKGFLR